MLSANSRVPRLTASACRLANYCVRPCSPLEFSGACQPILRESGEDKDFESVARECTLQDRRNAADLLFQKKKEAYLRGVQKYSANPDAVFTNNEFSMKYISVYGFDMDYTLVQYTAELHKYTYKTALQRLISELNYPAMLRGMNYDPEFAIRGLHCDSKNGLLMKIDAYNYIQKGSAYRGHNSVSVMELDELYRGLHVPMSLMDQHSNTVRWSLTQFLDMFSLPAAAMFADISQYLIDHGISYDPGNLYQDIQSVIYDLHISGHLHREILSDLEQYLKPHRRLPELLNRLTLAGKQLFIITNSPYSYLSKVMSYQMGAEFREWSELFDVIVVGAKKPSFYQDTIRPFRLVNTVSMTPTWVKVEKLSRGEVYQQGNVKSLIRFMNWRKKDILYFGDHVFTDLAEPVLHHGWKTGAIIPELEEEIKIANSQDFKQSLACMLALESLLKKPNVSQVGQDVVEMWKTERDKFRLKLKQTHNTRFGSVFRTEKNPTYFSRRLASFSNLYTSSLENLLQYSLDHTFIPRRAALPHEPDLNFDL